MVDLYDIIDAIGECVSNDEYNKKYDKLEFAYNEASKSGHLTEADEEDLQKRIAEEEAKLDFLQIDEAEVLNTFN